MARIGTVENGGVQYIGNPRVQRTRNLYEAHVTVAPPVDDPNAVIERTKHALRGEIVLNSETEEPGLVVRPVPGQERMITKDRREVTVFQVIGHIAANVEPSTVGVYFRIIAEQLAAEGDALQGCPPEGAIPPLPEGFTPIPLPQ